MFKSYGIELSFSSVIQQDFKTIFLSLGSWIIMVRITEQSGLGFEYLDTQMFIVLFGGHFKENTFCISYIFCIFLYISYIYMHIYICTHASKYIVIHFLKSKYYQVKTWSFHRHHEIFFSLFSCLLMSLNTLQYKFIQK